MEESKRILMVGAGAVGGVTAAILAREHYDVWLVAKYPELAEKITSEGIDVSGYCGDFCMNVPAVAQAAELTGKFDYVFMATKADALVKVAREILPFIHEQSRVVSLQNGICEEALASVVGGMRMIGCVVGWGATMIAPGKVEMTSGGEFVVGNWERDKDEKLEEVARILRHVLPTETSHKILSHLYSKFIINSCITTLGAISGLFLGEMLAKRYIRNIFIEIIREAIVVADAIELNVKPYAGRLNYYKFLRSGVMSSSKRHLTIRLIGYKYRKLKSSSLQSLERGRKTEIDFFNGYISSKGKEYGVSTPVNSKLTRMVQEIENGKRSISVNSLEEI
ncbi:MAG: 2-dehydropantoate 2-reductase [Bacteroidales bacterium]|nr:2-dehydropantoate 2-reductase [Bacteroidales bacterium]